MTVRVAWDVPRPAWGERALSDDDIAEAARAALAHGGRAELDVDVVLVGDATLTELHGRFLDDPTPTDVITFDLGEEGGGPAAEVYASVECALRVAAERGLDPAYELSLYVVHGALHLCGFDDVDDAPRAEMRAAETTVLTSLGFSAPPPPSSNPR